MWSDANAIWFVRRNLKVTLARDQISISLTYLSMTTGSEGVSFRLPHDFFSQHRLKNRGRKKWKILFCPKKEYSKIIFKIVYCYYNNIVWVILWRALNACPIISLTSALYESMSSHRDWCPLGQKIWISSNMHTLVAKLPKLFS